MFFLKPKHKSDKILPPPPPFVFGEHRTGPEAAEVPLRDYLQLRLAQSGAGQTSQGSLLQPYGRNQ